MFAPKKKNGMFDQRVLEKRQPSFERMPTNLQTRRPQLKCPMLRKNVFLNLRSQRTIFIERTSWKQIDTLSGQQSTNKLRESGNINLILSK